MGLFYSIRGLQRSHTATAYRLLCDPEILDRQVLLPGAIMEDFVRVLGTNLQLYQWMAVALLAITGYGAAIAISSRARGRITRCAGCRSGMRGSGTAGACRCWRRRRACCSWS